MMYAAGADLTKMRYTDTMQPNPLYRGPNPATGPYGGGMFTGGQAFQSQTMAGAPGQFGSPQSGSWAPSQQRPILIAGSGPGQRSSSPMGGSSQQNSRVSFGQASPIPPQSTGTPYQAYSPQASPPANWQQLPKPPAPKNTWREEMTARGWLKEGDIFDPPANSAEIRRQQPWNPASQSFGQPSGPSIGGWQDAIQPPQTQGKRPWGDALPPPPRGGIGPQTQAGGYGVDPRRPVNPSGQETFVEQKSREMMEKQNEVVRRQQDTRRQIGDYMNRYPGITEQQALEAMRADEAQKRQQGNDAYIERYGDRQAKAELENRRRMERETEESRRIQQERQQRDRDLINAANNGGEQPVWDGNQYVLPSQSPIYGQRPQRTPPSVMTPTRNVALTPLGQARQANPQIANAGFFPIPPGAARPIPPQPQGTPYGSQGSFVPMMRRTLG